jgi:cephalosporin-C deacetylase-like acetyl esterase
MHTSLKGTAPFSGIVHGTTRCLKRALSPLWAVLLIAGSVAAAWCYDGARAPDSLFAYDSTQPLDVQVDKVENFDQYGARIEHLSYPSPVAGRVTALLVLPKDARAGEHQSTPYAGIIFLHWGQGDQSEFVWEALLYAGSGAVSILVDAPWARPKPWTQPGESYVNPEADKQMYVQNIKDLRRAVDLLLARGDVDPARIAYVGHSFGATQGGIFAGVEKRVRTFILMAGLPSVTDLAPTGARKFDEMSEMLKQYLTADQLQAHRDLISPLDPVKFIGDSSPASMLMQFGLYDSWISRTAAETYFAAGGDPKEVRWYPASHELNDISALADRARWLEREVGLRPVAPRLGAFLD